jgi:hypothetical protein
MEDIIRSNFGEQKNDITGLLGTDKGQVDEHLRIIDEIREGIFNIAAKIFDWLKKTENTIVNTIEAFDKYDIYVCYRDTPSFSSENINVIDYDNVPRSLNDIMPLGPWTKSFAANKWAGYVFARENIVPIVNMAARHYFLQSYNLHFLNEFKYAYLKKQDMEVTNKIQETVDLAQI